MKGNMRGNYGKSFFICTGMGGEKTMERHPEIDKALEVFSRELQPLMRRLSDTFERWEMQFQPFLKELEPVFQELAKLADAAAPYVHKFVRYHKIVEKFERTGWLPYHLAPVEYVENYEGDAIHLESKISEYYLSEWHAIRADIESRLNDYHIDDEARDTFREAFSAHEHENYRCVCRVLFPEIERAIKRNLFIGAGNVRTNEMLERLTGERPLEDFVSKKAFGLVLFGRLVEHLYERASDEERSKFEQNFVPNRHAAIHGLVPYSTHKHSMNMIIMADYIFQILPPPPATTLSSASVMGTEHDGN